MLQGCPYFARQYLNSKGRQAYRPCRDLAKLTQGEADIFEGRSTVGFYSIRPDNLTRWGAVDFDAHGSDAVDWNETALSAFNSLASTFAETWLVESSPGGFHVLAFGEDLIPAREMRATLAKVAPEGVEVFPKQDTLNPNDPNAKGSLLRFPGKHQGKGTWARFVARAGCVANVECELVAPKAWNWIEPSTEGRLRSLYVTTTKGIAVTGRGQRFHAMQKIAGRLKGRATRDEALWVYSAWHHRHEANIGTPFDESRREFLAWYDKANPCEAIVPDYPLTAREEAMIAAFPKFLYVRAEHLAAVARWLLCAAHHSRAKGLETFWFSCPQLGERLGTSYSTAQRVRKAAEKAMSLKIARAGSTGWATEYKLED